MISASLPRLNELAFEAVLDEDTGEPWRGKGESELGLSLCEILKKPLRLLRPIVDVEVRPDGSGGVGSRISSLREPIVDDLPREPRRAGGAREGDDRAEWADFPDCCRSK